MVRFVGPPREESELDDHLAIRPHYEAHEVS